MEKEVSFDRQLGILVERTESFSRDLHSIKQSLERLADSHAERVAAVEARVASLELDRSAQAGGMKAISMLAGLAATLGGIAAFILDHVWSWTK